MTPPAGVPSQSLPPQLLIVEDSLTQALELRRMLEGKGFRVVHAGSAEGALEFLNDELPDLVISDYHLPGMNGDELVRQIRQNSRTRGLPIILLTQDDAKGIERQGLESGADAYVPKSSDPSLLDLRIRALLRSRGVQGDVAAVPRGAFTRFRRGRLLLLYNDPARGDIVANALKKDGYGVEVTSSATLALKLAAETGPDCVLLSLDMPGALASCERLSKLRETSAPGADGALNFYVVGVECGQGQAVIAAAYQAGVDDVITFDADSDALTLRVRSLVRRKLAQEEGRRQEGEAREQQLQLVQAKIAAAAADAKVAAAEAARMAALLESERRFRVIFDTGFQMTWLLDTAGAIVVANQTALAFLGTDDAPAHAQVLWDSPWWAGAPVEAEKLRAAFSQDAVKGRPATFEAKLMDHRDKRRILAVSLRPALNSAGGVAQVVVEAHDVTEVRKAEAALHQSQKMEALGQLTGGVAHDFNNLLMVIMSNLRLLQRRLVHEDPKITQFIEGAMEGAQRGATLTQRLLAFGRRQELNAASVDVGVLLRGMRSLLENSAGALVTIHWGIPEAPHYAVADTNQLELAILNLVVNARDAMPGGGSIRIDVDAAEIERPESDLKAGSYICVRISDSGTGMDAETIKHATEPFFSTKDVGKGTGLGLSMVHGLAVQSGGALRLFSEPGKGTTAVLWLPLGFALEATPEAAKGETAACAPATVLVVDDDRLIARSTTFMLEEMGHTVITTHSPKEGLAVLASGAAVDLLVTDFAMPEMNGAEFALAARKLRPALPILLATGYAEIPSDMPITFPRISKPYSHDQLQRHVTHILTQGAEAAV